MALLKVGVLTQSEAKCAEPLKEAVLAFEEEGIDVILNTCAAEKVDRKGIPNNEIKADIYILIGNDRFVLNFLLSRPKEQIKVLPVAPIEEAGFLSEINVAELETIAPLIKEQKWTIERRTRLQCKINGSECPPLLNDLAIFSKKSATLIRYTLIINDERMWRDGADGLIIATPTGSTGYSLSAGGPVIGTKSAVFGITPVNSINLSRRALVVPDDSKIKITELESSGGISVVLDGQKRVNLTTNEIQIWKSDKPVEFITFSKSSLAEIQDKLKQKINLFDIVTDIPPSAKLILKILEYEGKLTQRELIEESKLPPRTVRYALSLLLELGLITKRTMLRDSRFSIYSIKK